MALLDPPTATRSEKLQASKDLPGAHHDIAPFLSLLMPFPVWIEAIDVIVIITFGGRRLRFIGIHRGASNLADCILLISRFE
jgi:hypothetical protein